MHHLVLVFFGGGFGSLCRWGLGLLLQPWQHKFPWATLAANGLACLVLGALLGLQFGGDLSTERRLLLATGFCGGFSTFSTFTAETFLAFQSGAYMQAALNIFGNLTLCFICLILGFKWTV
ncbi:MAG: fluoride efflux transporter CrcB [Saprospiraceae bacterium]|nr:fluoride efflux transporter CrcB [Saprospiraceae bacterium]